MPDPTPPQAPAGLDVLTTWIGRAFRLFGAAWPAWLVAGLLAWVVLLACFVLPLPYLRAEITPLLQPPRGLDDLEFFAHLTASLPHLLLVLGGVALLYSLLQIFFVGGFVRMAGWQLDGQEIGAADIFSAGDVFWPLLLSLSQVMLYVALGACVCVIPGLLLGGLYTLTAPLVVVRRLGPWASMTESARLAKQNMPLFVLLNVTVLVIQGIGSVLPFALGTIATFPLSWLILTVAYADIYAPRETEA